MKKKNVKDLSIEEILQQGVFRLPLDQKRLAVEKATIEALKNPTPKSVHDMYRVIVIASRPDCGLVWSDYHEAATNVVKESK